MGEYCGKGWRYEEGSIGPIAAGDFEWGYVVVFTGHVRTVIRDKNRDVS